ncbi:PEFG-CTERM sorting domain-containing protein [Nitrosopumilus sp.]|uniref:PEFG-CTERM sorting domain-containing protein n=1 Tax=Nitrosopumilus sp. TaxID=2024843 RepID=UPI00247E50E2|nr:PEFG-CTERM sorting domain-containing protein [Nitrosopumilus sp.]MCV0430625.1 PEFG-CTERM sorting domain-containing protein [Nitrosopumilus sp.]
MSSAYAASGDIPEACVGCSMEDAKATANKMLREALPVSVWTDKTGYGHSDMIMVTGQVANVASGFPVTVTVVSPLNSIVTVDQVNVSQDGTFETTLNTAGAMWKYDGTYTIKVNYGSAEKSNSAKVELTGGEAYTPNYNTPNNTKQCGSNEISANGQCVPFTISGGMVTGAKINTDDNSIVIMINAKDDGTLTVSPTKTTIDGIFMVLVDGEEWDDVEIVANKVTVMFPAGAEKIEIIGTHVIPEFGTIAAMILAVAIISIIAVSAKSRLSIVPRY